ncbi:MAG: N-acetyltransferase [Gemmatales bacterium]|nr:GNAT family N-acetyltransferase [Gemmatales bacterium]MDW8175766.1 N-acetyltransferase [Gemmatales bacterium]
MSSWQLILRNLEERDRARTLELAIGTGVFRPVELAVLQEVIEEYIRAPEAGDYHALVAELTLVCKEPSSHWLNWPSEQEEVTETGLTVHSPSHSESVGSIGQGIAGFVIFGPTPLTAHTWDIYWIVVGQEYQHRGIGSRLLEAAEARIRAQRGAVIRIETSSQPSYEATRRFYEKHGYERAGAIPDFYARGDDLIVYYKRRPASQASDGA